MTRYGVQSGWPFPDCFIALGQLAPCRCNLQVAIPRPDGDHATEYVTGSEEEAT